VGVGVDAARDDQLTLGFNSSSTTRDDQVVTNLPANTQQEGKLCQQVDGQLLTGGWSVVNRWMVSC